MTRTKQQEAEDVLMGEGLMESARGCAAEAGIEAYLQQRGLLRDKSISDKGKAEESRHRKYVLRDNIRVFLKRYRAQKDILLMVREEMEARVEVEDIGALGDGIPSAANEGYFSKLCRKLDLLSAYDEKAMRNRYETRLTACRYIEEAITTLERGARILRAHHPESYRILNTVYFEGPSQPTIKEAIAALDLSGSSSYYQKLERAEQQLAGIVLSCTLDQNNFIQMLVYLKQQDTDGNFPWLA